MRESALGGFVNINGRLKMYGNGNKYDTLIKMHCMTAFVNLLQETSNRDELPHSDLRVVS